MMAACRADALSKVYGRRDTAVHALREITLSIPSQAFTAIMGPSGSGKSTLLHCLAALDTPTSGRVFLGQTELTSLSRRQQAQVRRDRIGFVFQSFNLVPTLDTIENITLPQLLAGRRPDKEWLEYVVAQIGLGDRLHHRPSQLSGGQQQRVALARALAGRPEVIFADEPTGNLDTRASREMLALLRSAVDDFRQTVVTVTHDPAIAGYADQVLFFTDGQVVDQVLQPETSLVLEHLQYLDSSTPAHVGPRGQLHASTQSDGQHTMRSRRRRRADETGPGRPMVGSDDEVEVARQERWLQRIREQFEVEHEDPDATSHHADNGMHTGAATHTGNGVRPGMGSGAAPAQPAQNGHQVYGTYETSNGFHPQAPNGQHSNGQHRVGDDSGVIDAVVDDDTGWLPAERSWLTPAPDDDGQHTGAQDTLSQTAANAYTGPPAQGPVSQRWHTSDWEAEPHTQRWDAAPADHGQQAAWQQADDQRTGTWHPPVTGAVGSESIMPDNRDWPQTPAQDPAADVWSDPDPAAHEEWAEIMPSQPPAPAWGASPAPGARDGWNHPVSEPQPGTWQPWQPDQVAPEPAPGPVANGHHNGVQMPASPYDDAQDNGAHTARYNAYDEVEHNSHHEPADGAQPNGTYGAAPEPAPDAYGPAPEPAQPNTTYGAAPEPPQSNGTYGAPEPPQSNGTSAGWSVGPPDAGHDDGSRGWDAEAEVVAEPESLDIWSPAVEETWAPAASDDTGTWTPAHTPPPHAPPTHTPPTQAHPLGDDPSQTGPFETIDPAPPGTDRTAAWSADPPAVDDDPYRPDPRSPRRHDDTTTDPFEALHSLQSQLNRLGGAGRRPPRPYGE
jgi:putative ABC transport system ATP-binding protein